MREYYGFMPTVEAHFAHDAVRRSAQADDRMFIAPCHGKTLRQQVKPEMFATHLNAARKRTAIKQPPPQARIAADGLRLPEGIRCFHAKLIFPPLLS